MRVTVRLFLPDVINEVGEYLSTVFFFFFWRIEVIRSG